MDRFLKDLGTIGYKAGIATFFEDINLGLDIGVSRNEHADIIAGAAFLSGWHLPFHLDKCFIVVNSSVVSGNFGYFAVSVFCDSKVASLEIVKFVYFLGLTFRNNVWVVHAKHHVYIKKAGLILLNGLVFMSIFGLTSEFFVGVIKLLDITKAFGV
ncbi:hypothetical protein G9A89_004862 [Geosiphon pyriformis]|nr:hypothetical protein G9A89_004862 [Geosiphon pyriformis]